MHSTDQLLLDLGQMAGLPQPLRFDQHGCARLMFDAHLGIDFERHADAGLIQVYSVLGPVPAEGRDALFQQLLEANLFGADTGGSTLALDSEMGEVVLCRSVATDGMAAAAFVQLVEQFASVAEDWKTRLARHKAPATSTAAAPLQPVDQMPGMGAFLRA